MPLILALARSSVRPVLAALCRDPHAPPTYARGFRAIRRAISTCVGSGTLFYSEGINCSSVRTRAKSVPAYIVKFRRASRNRKELEEFIDSFKELPTKMDGHHQLAQLHGELAPSWVVTASF
jgi:hypothetical protein